MNISAIVMFQHMCVCACACACACACVFACFVCVFMCCVCVVCVCVCCVRVLCVLFVVCVVFGSFQICVSIKPWSINTCNISINMIRQNYVSAAYYGTKYSSCCRSTFNLNINNLVVCLFVCLCVCARAHACVFV